MSAGKELFEQLKPWLKKKQCRTCDCTQGALVELELSGDEELKRLVAPHRVPTNEVHGCLGCDPCPPGAAWAFLICQSKK